MNLRSIASGVGRRTWQVAAALAVTLATGCGNPEGTWQMPLQASEQAAQVDWIYYFIFWLCAFYFVHIMAVMGWFMWRYRRRPGHEVEHSPHHSLGLEIAWSIPPVILCVVMFYLGFTRYMEMSIVPRDAVKVEVDAKKWAWSFTYPTGATSNELHLPPNKPVVFLLKSQDVLHSFYLPKMRVKKDVVPGRTNKAWTTPNRPGEYWLFCAEYCGSNHSTMRAKVIVHETVAAYEAAIIPKAASPEKLFSMHCSSCHNINNAEINVGPSLQNFAAAKRKEYDPASGQVVEVDPTAEYVRESIVYPGKLLSRMGKEFGNEMTQTFGKQLKPEELDWLVKYVLDPEAAQAEFKAQEEAAAEKSE